MDPSREENDIEGLQLSLTALEQGIRRTSKTVISTHANTGEDNFNSHSPRANSIGKGGGTRSGPIIEVALEPPSDIDYKDQNLSIPQLIQLRTPTSAPRSAAGPSMEVALEPPSDIEYKQLHLSIQELRAPSQSRRGGLVADAREVRNSPVIMPKSCVTAQHIFLPEANARLVEDEASILLADSNVKPVRDSVTCTTKRAKLINTDTSQTELNRQHHREQAENKCFGRKPNHSLPFIVILVLVAVVIVLSVTRIEPSSSDSSNEDPFATQPPTSLPTTDTANSFAPSSSDSSNEDPFATQPPTSLPTTDTANIFATEEYHCVSSSDCSPDEPICVAGKCTETKTPIEPATTQTPTTVADSCSTNRDCLDPSFPICSDEPLCVNDSRCHTCDGHDDCPDGEFCICTGPAAGACAPEEQIDTCSDNYHCPSSSRPVCANSPTCVNDLRCHQCDSDDDCDPLEFCQCTGPDAGSCRPVAPA